MKDLHVKSQDGQLFSSLVLTPAGEGPFPTILLIQEIFGINANMRWTAQQFADAGFLVFVPDLFWRTERGIDLDPANPEQRTRAMGLNSQFDVKSGLSDCRQTIAVARSHALSSGKVGAVGYCLGGRLAFLLAMQDAVDAAVCFYPVGIQLELSTTPLSRTPLYVHLAADDVLCTPDAQRAVTEYVLAQPTNRVETYGGVGHGFARLGRTGVAHAAALGAEKATFNFLKGILKTAL